MFFLSLGGSTRQEDYVVSQMGMTGSPKSLGGWGLNNIFVFSKVLAAKAGWQLISSSNLWMEVAWHK